jgi:hypothetical protein
VTDPDGYNLPQATVGVAYTSTGINFTLNDAGEDANLGDVYTIAVTNGGTFSVKDPSGNSLPNAVIGTYTNAQINFTLADGATDFIVGDTFTIAVSNGGTFSVKDPDGNAMPDAIIGAYSNAQINFTLTDGSPDFVVGDTFTITIAAGSGKYNKSLAAAVDGSQEPCAILGRDTDATSEDVATSAYIAGTFNENYLTYGTGHTAASTRSDLSKRGVYIKTPVIAN